MAKKESCNCHNSGYYPSSCLLFKNSTQLYRFVRTSQETYYIFATSPRGCRFVTMVYLHNYHNSGYYPSSCFLFKTQLNLQVCPYLTVNTLRLRYEPNKLILSVGLWRWYINITITILDIIHRPVSYLKHSFSQTGFGLRLRMVATQLGPTGRAVPVSGHQLGDRIQSQTLYALNKRQDDG
jgi:hypothetical protein